MGNNLKIIILKILEYKFRYLKTVKYATKHFFTWPVIFRVRVESKIYNLTYPNSLRKKFPYSELFWSVFSRIQIE